jgi:hypothetical protein
LQPCFEIRILFDLSYVQLRTTNTAPKTIKIAKSQSRLRAIGTERLNSRLWHTEIFLQLKSLTAVFQNIMHGSERMALTRLSNLLHSER